MKRKKFTEEQIINILRQGDDGKKPEELSREYGMAIGTYYAWKAKFGGMDVNEAQRLRTLEEENRRLKTLVADQALDIRALQSVIKAVEQRAEVQRLQRDFGLSERRACRLMQQPRRSHRYKPAQPPVIHLCEAIQKVAYEHPRYGYRRVWDLLREENQALGLRRVYRLYRLQGLTMKRRRPKRARRGERIAMPAATAANHRWSMDFIHDQLEDGRSFRVLNIIDDFTREAVACVVDTSISGRRVARHLDKLAVSRGLPKVITCDNGTEITSHAMQAWASRHDVRLNFSIPGKPTQNAFVESFNGRMRDEFLNQHLFFGLHDAR
ncbi:UNVERIFIED_CONTAM: Insertion element IS476 uncharacterized protein, partial [Trichonephila clavipes]